MKCLLVSGDMMFGSRVRNVAQRLNVPCLVQAPAQAASAEADPDLAVVMIDLTRVSDEMLAELIARFRKNEPAPRIVAYGPHVDHEVLARAQTAGCDDVLTKGQFDQSLGEIIRSASDV